MKDANVVKVDDLVEAKKSVMEKMAAERERFEEYRVIKPGFAGEEDMLGVNSEGSGGM